MSMWTADRHYSKFTVITTIRGWPKHCTNKTSQSRLFLSDFSVTRYHRSSWYYKLPVFVSPSTLAQSLCLWLTSSCAYHIVFLCWVNTHHHNSRAVSLWAHNLPISQVSRTMESCPSGLPPWSITRTISCEPYRFLFLILFHIFYVFGSMQQIKLASR